MNETRRFPKPIDWCVMGAGLAFLIVLQADDVGRALTPAQTDDFPSVYEAARVLEGDEYLPGRSGEAAIAAYKEFLETAGYFGAFAVSGREGYGWSDNYTTQAEADEMALARCEQHAQDCRIVARLTPDAATDFGGQPLSQTQAKALDGFARWPGAKAVAINEQGAWGGGWKHVTRAAAEADALERCRAYTRKNKLRPATTQECRIVFSE